MKQRFIKSVLMVALCMAFGTTAAQTIIVNNSNGSKDAPVKPNIDMTKYDKRILKNGNEVYTPKHDNSIKKLNAEETELVNVTFLLSYDPSIMYSSGEMTISGNSIEDVWMDYDFENDSYQLTYQLPIGTYDFLTSCFLMEGGLAYNVKELVEINKDTTMTFDFAESNIRHSYKTFKPSGEEATLNSYQSDGNIINGNTLCFLDRISLILKGSGTIGSYSSMVYWERGINPSATIFLNSLSDRYKLASERILQDENGVCIIKYESNDMNETLLQNNPENFVLYEEEFNSIGNDKNGLFQGFSTIEMIDNINNGGMLGNATIPISTPLTKVYVDPNRKEGDEPSKFDIMILPIFQDNVSVPVLYSWYEYDDMGNPTIEHIDTMQIFRTITGLPVMINNDGSMEYVNTGHDAAGNYGFHVPEGGGDIIEYPGHPQFSFASQQKALPYGSNCPINAFMAQNSVGYMGGKYSAVAPCFIGRFGEIVGGYYTTDIRYNGELITNNYLTRDQDMYNFAAQGNPDGVITAHFENTNAVVDGLQGRNVTDVYYDQRQADWTAPTLQMLLFKDREGNIIDRFATADEGTLEFAGGDFNYHTDGAYWFDCKEQTVEVSYSPYNADQWLALDVEEVPGEFYMPGFGYFYRGSLEDVTNPSATGWYDLRIKLTDLSGNWQEQVISPAFRIGNSTPTGIEVVTSNDATEVARYTIDGRAISAPQAGVNIVKMSDGTVKKVLVK